MPERPKGPDSKSGERFALRGFESLSLRMGHTSLRVFLLLPLLLCACGAGTATLAPSPDSTADVTSDHVIGPEVVGDIGVTDSAPPEDLQPLPECLSDDDCQGLAVAIPLCRRVICDDGACVQIDAADGTPCDTGTPCREPGACADGVCEEPELSCEDGDPCTGTTCDGVDGCLFEPLEGVACDDGDPCTATDLCVEGACVGAGETVCDDGNACTQDGCDPWFGCVHLDLDALCDDGDPCTGDDQCVYGTCIGMTDVCECDVDADCAVFVNACFSAYTCATSAVPRVCVPVPASETPCPDVGPCLAGACDPATEACAPVPKPDGTPCVDSIVCVAEGECLAGICVGTPLECPGEAAGPCFVPACVPGEGCVAVPAPGPCDDDDPCTVNDWCVDGACDALEADCAPAPPALFRIISLGWDGPGLVFSGPGGVEVGLDEALNVALNQALGDAYAPLDLLVGFTSMETTGSSALRLQAGACLRDDAGAVTGCPWPGDDAEIGPMTWCLDALPCAGISGAPPAPGFGASGVPAASLGLPGALGGVLGAESTEVAGQLLGLPEPVAITAGTLSLFLTEDAAGAVTLSPPLMAALSLAELLDPAALTSVDDLQGWWLHLDFEAVRTPILP